MSCGKYFRSVAMLVVLMIVAFFFKETIFSNIIFAPDI